MINFTSIIGIIMLFAAIVYLRIDTHKQRMKKQKDEEEFEILDRILYRFKLKEENTRSIDEVFENLKKNDIQINFKLDFGMDHKR